MAAHIRLYLLEERRSLGGLPFRVRIAAHAGELASLGRLRLATHRPPVHRRRSE
jgi:hypothetical protein